MLALGDSITNGGGELQWGVAMKSWAEWTARGLGLPYTGLAMDGARVEDVLAEQIARFDATAPRADTRFDLGCLWIGVNDARSSDWDGLRFRSGLARTLDWLARRCDRVLAVTSPLDLGRPRAGRKVEELGRLVEEEAARAGALILDLRALRARNLVMSDHVHLTAFGQVWVAQRALEVLAADGMAVTVEPSQLIRWETSRWGRLRSDLTYLCRHAKVSARAVVAIAQTRAAARGG